MIDPETAYTINEFAMMRPWPFALCFVAACGFFAVCVWAMVK